MTDAGKEMLELTGTFSCPICSKDTPHSHEPRQVEIEQFCRPAFERHFHHWMELFIHPGGELRGHLRIKGWSNKPLWSLRASQRRRIETGADYEDPKVEAFWKLWLLAWRGKPSWCAAFDDIANAALCTAASAPSVKPDCAEIERATIERLRDAMTEACDLLAGRLLGSPARSPGHNARLVLERALSVTGETK